MKSSRAQLWVILSIVFLGYLCSSIPYLIFPSIFLNPSYAVLPSGWSAAARGLFLGSTLAAYPLGQFVGSPIVGGLSDEYGRRTIVTTCFLLSALCSLATGLSLESGLIWLVIVSRFAAGLMEGTLALGRAIAADSKQLCKQSAFGKICATSCIAYVIGPAIGIFLSTKSMYENFSLATPFFMISLLCVMNAVIAYFAASNQPREIKREIQSFSQRINFVARLRRLLQNRQLKLVLVTVSLHTLVSDVFYEMGPAYLISRWALVPSKLALYNMALSLSLAMSSAFAAGWLAKRYLSSKVLKWSMAILIGCILSVWLAPIQPPLALFALVGFMLAIPGTNLTVRVSDSISDDIQGEVLGFKAL